MQQAARSVGILPSHPGNPYRDTPRAESEAVAWTAFPGPGSIHALVWTVAFACFALMPLACGTICYASWFVLGSGAMHQGGGSVRDLVDTAAAQASDALSQGFTWGAVGCVGCLLAVTTGATWWSRQRSRLAPTLPRWPAPGWPLTLLMTALAAAIWVSLGPLAWGDSWIVQPGRDALPTAPRALLPTGAPAITAYNPIVIVSSSAFQVDDEQVNAEALPSRLSTYRDTYPWWHGSDRFAVVAGARHTPMARIRAALHAAYAAGYPRSVIPVQRDCHTETSATTAADVQVCRLQSVVVAMDGSCDTHETVWSATSFGEFIDHLRHRGDNQVVCMKI